MGFAKVGAWATALPVAFQDFSNYPPIYKEITMNKSPIIAKLLAMSMLAATVAAPLAHAADPATSDTTTTAPKAQRSTGAYIDDSVITAKVKAALVEDKQVSAMKIKVQTRNGVVTLKGSVPSAEAGQHALQLAAGVEGVKDVKSDLTVKAA